MINTTIDRASLRLSATLLLVGQLLYVVVTLLHTVGGEDGRVVIGFPAGRARRWATSATRVNHWRRRLV